MIRYCRDANCPKFKALFTCCWDCEYKNDCNYKCSWCGEDDNIGDCGNLEESQIKK